MLTNEQIRVPQIKAAQLSALLILSRMFIILIFLPNTHHSVGGSVAILSIIVGFFLTFLVMIPLFFLLRQYPGMNLQQVAKQLDDVIPMPQVLLLVAKHELPLFPLHAERQNDPRAEDSHQAGGFDPVGKPQGVAALRFPHGKAQAVQQTEIA